jgi:hypothetical protein
MHEFKVWRDGESERESEKILILVHLMVSLVCVLKFNKHCSIFVLFDKKFPILN